MALSHPPHLYPAIFVLLHLHRLRACTTARKTHPHSVRIPVVKVPGPIFFYFGNEDNVELYVNHTGLMWESAEEFGAALVFAEHRFYGQSNPFTPNTNGCMGLLTSEQVSNCKCKCKYCKYKCKCKCTPVYLLI